MANEFKVRNRVVVNGSGSTILDVQGSQGQLFTINDSLSGSLYSVKNNLGVPVIQAFSDATVKMGAFGAEAIRVSGSFTTTTGSLLGTSSYAINALSASNALNSDYALSSSFASLATSASFAQTASATPYPLFPFTGSAQIIGQLVVTGSVTTTGSLSITGSVGFAYENPNSGVWSVINNLNVSRGGLAGAGISTAALAFGGLGPSAPFYVSCTEAYNGTSWSVRNALSTPRYAAGGAGTQNAALTFGGQAPIGNITCTEAYNGTSWSVRNALSTPRYNLAGVGTQNAALAISGKSPSAQICFTTDVYNGTTWSLGGNVINANQGAATAGISTAALMFGGANANNGAWFTNTEIYNGATWSTGNVMTNARSLAGGSGTQTSALTYGGWNPVIACTEAYNGSTWSGRNALITARCRLTGAGPGTGTRTSALAIGAGSTEAFSTLLQTFNYNQSTGNTFLSSSLNVTGSINVSGSGFIGNTIINNLTASIAISASFASNVIPIASKSITILNNGYLQQSDTGSYPVWRIPFPFTASQILAFSTSSLSPFSGSLVNISNNISASLLALPLVLTGSTWVSSSVIQYPTFSAGDMLSFNFLTLTGSLTEVIIQINYIK
jgi:hypothetical protein